MPSPTCACAICEKKYSVKVFASTVKDRDKIPGRVSVSVSPSSWMMKTFKWVRGMEPVVIMIIYVVVYALLVRFL
jgi:hypothetical protein